MSLIGALEKKGARYSVDWGFFGDFLAGAPASQDDRQRLLLDFSRRVHREVCAEYATLDADKQDCIAAGRIVAQLDEVLRDTTEKSIGLLQALAILSAVIAITLDQPQGSFEAAYGNAVLASTLATTLLLFANIGLTWRRKKNYYNDGQALIQDIYALLLVRAHRLRVAQWCSFLCFLFVFIPTILGVFYPEVFSIVETGWNAAAAAIDGLIASINSSF